MKKILTLFAVVGMMAFSSCSNNDDDVDYDTIAEVYENVAPNYYNFTNANGYAVTFNFPSPIYDSDVVLVYRFDGTDTGGRPVWQALPETYYFDNGSRDFSLKYVFTYNYVNIYLDGNDQATIPSDYRLNQIFRIVVVPASFAASVDKTNYLEVMKAAKLTESQVQKIKL
ncbi:hypothetical protein [Flavobacterium panacagri]|uniref:hypothetical protein n=1 Tax=Flavobacterium panacagri TaxID=3034146 RepID=UPI0025A675F0|nr:hypothetical protein [Flavobacterium panacagri]